MIITSVKYWTSKVLINVVGIAVSFFDILIPKKRRFVFAVGPYKTLSGNIKSSYDYFAKQSRAETFLLVDRTSDLSLLDDPNHSFIVEAISIRGIILLLTSKFIFVEYHSSDWFWKGLRPKRHTFINLWHGIPIKRIGFTGNNHRGFKKESKIFKHFISSSDIDRAMMSSCFGIPYSNVLLTGYPRNDIFFQNDSVVSDGAYNLLSQKIDRIKSNKTLILYAPTFRGDFRTQHRDQNGVYPFTVEELDKLRQILQSNNAILGIRPHINKISDNRLVYDDTIIDLSREIIKDAQLLLKYTDILVSDYSGIWIDYLLLNRPIVGFAYDKREYQMDRGYLYDYDAVFPGPIVQSFQQFASTIIECLKERQHTLDREERHMFVKDLFHKYQDGSSCQRLYNHCLND